MVKIGDFCVDVWTITLNQCYIVIFTGCFILLFFGFFVCMYFFIFFFHDIDILILICIFIWFNYHVIVILFSDPTQSVCKFSYHKSRKYKTSLYMIKRWSVAGNKRDPPLSRLFIFFEISEYPLLYLFQPPLIPFIKLQVLQGFIQALLMSGRQHKMLNLLSEFSNSIFIKIYFKAYWYWTYIRNTLAY